MRALSTRGGAPQVFTRSVNDFPLPPRYLVENFTQAYTNAQKVVVLRAARAVRATMLVHARSAARASRALVGVCSAPVCCCDPVVLLVGVVGLDGGLGRAQLLTQEYQILRSLTADHRDAGGACPCRAEQTSSRDWLRVRVQCWPSATSTNACLRWARDAVRCSAVRCGAVP